MLEPVTVIITCYNLEKYIDAAIESVKAQTYGGNVQLVVVDDCSTDNCPEILRNMLEIELISLRCNSGVMVAMIAGLQVARYDAVFFLDGDDVWHPDKLMNCMKQFGRHCGLCTHDLWYIDNAGRKLSRPSRVSDVLASVDAAERPSEIAKCILNHGDYVWLGSAFGVRRSVGAIDEFIAFCNSSSKLKNCYQDWPLAVWVVLRSNSNIAYVDQKLFGYRIHADNYSGSSQTMEKMQRNIIKATATMGLIEKILENNRGTARHITVYRRVRMTYELLLASTKSSRLEICRATLELAPRIEFSTLGFKALLRIVMALVLGSARAYRLIEKMK